MPAFRRGHHHGALLLQAERGHGFGFRLRHGRKLDLLALAVQAVEFAGDARRLARVLLQQQPHAEVGAADAAAGIDAGPEQEAEMPRLGRPRQPRGVHQRGQADLIAAAQRDHALGDEGAVEAGERHHVGDGAERDQMQQRQQVRLAP